MNYSRLSNSQLFQIRQVYLDDPHELGKIDREINRRLDGANESELESMYQTAESVMGETVLSTRKKYDPPPPSMFFVKVLKFFKLV